MAYFLGSAVSRMAQDFFNDDDLSIQVRHRLYVVVTEDSIRASAYCRMSKTLPADEALSDLTDDCDCLYHHGHPTLLYLVHSGIPAAQTKADRESKGLEDRVRDIFHFQESALLLKGQDETERLRQLHDQVMVLKGVALDGLVAFSLLLFGWCATFSPKWRWLLSIAPFVYLLVGSVALLHHLNDRKLSDPPFLEFTLILLAVSGGYVLWRYACGQSPARGERYDQGSVCGHEV
jgi:hypothetical protein